jgi:undecaprenyl diphosphate synthase
MEKFEEQIHGDLQQYLLSVNEIDERLPECPDVDLLIRTGGEQRLSNYLLWHVAYAEQIYTDTLWPDYSNDEFYSHIEAFQHRNRRFGAEKAFNKKGN